LYSNCFLLTLLSTNEEDFAMHSSSSSEDEKEYENNFIDLSVELDVISNINSYFLLSIPISY